ncbi:MAG: DUF2325 domain-containing protein [Candidatus Desulforudis sp.]|nr:DUF2325 domain-containing protein [Desulforudis sp.]
MSREVSRQVVARLREIRRELYRQLAEQVGTPGERALANRANDLILAEEILLENERDVDDPPGIVKTGGNPLTIPSVQPAPDWEALNVSGDWEIVGEFFRLPRGGVVRDHGSGHEVFVPEAAVRGESMDHGDVVGARSKGVSDRSSPLYFFQVLRRRNLGDTSGRVCLIAPLEFRSGNWGVYGDEEELFITVPDGDVSSLGLDEGDLVEVAYESGDPSSARVAWKYDADDPFLEIRELRKESKRNKKGKEGLQEEEPQDLLGKSVLVVGADSYKESFKRVFERRGATFSWESGLMIGKFLEGKVRRADIVVIVTEAMKHKMPDVEAVCERYGRPYVYAPSRGASGALREVLDKFRTPGPGSV